MLFVACAIVGFGPEGTGMAMAQEAVKHIKSRHSIATTIERAERIAAYHDFRVLGIVDYAALAMEKNKQTPAARLLVFIDDKAEYAKVLRQSRLFALEFPFKLLVWEDDHGGVWVSYRPMAPMAAQYQLHTQAKFLAKLDLMVEALGREAAN